VRVGQVDLGVLDVRVRRRSRHEAAAVRVRLEQHRVIGARVVLGGLADGRARLDLARTPADRRADCVQCLGALAHLLHEILHGQAEDARDRHPQQRAAPLLVRVFRLADQEDRHDKEQGHADDAQRQVAARAVHGQPENGEEQQR
jgi:hypothetical protein